MATKKIRTGKRAVKEKKYLTLNMCDFCSLEYPACKATPLFSKGSSLNDVKLDPENAVIACDKYKSPVDILRKQFH